jgi:hypothetical protein
MQATHGPALVVYRFVSGVSLPNRLERLLSQVTE